VTDQPRTPGHDQPEPRTFEADPQGEVRQTPPPVIHSLGAVGPQAPAGPDYSAPAEQPGWSTPQQYPGHGYQAGQPYPTGAYAQPGYPYAPGGYAPVGYGQPAGYGQSDYGQSGYRAANYPPAGGQGGYPPPPGYYPPGGYWAPPPAPQKKHPHRGLYAGVAAAVAAAVAVGGVAIAVDHNRSASQQQASQVTPNQTQPNPFSDPFNFGNGQNGNGSNGQNGSGSGGSGATGTTGQATQTQSVGVVDIDTVLNFGQGKAAGTGIVLSSDGEILTNNHVVQGSTSITATVISTGKTYTAKVVGTDATDDIAVIKLQNASGLATAKLGDSSKVSVGTAVTAVGNAGGTGGIPTAATGNITALDQSITASDQDGSNSERLTGMFQVNANIQAGDSGGPLYENAGGTIIGINTAASVSGGRGRFGGTTTGTTGFAIPIAKATSIAQQILNGQASSKIRIGYPPFLGVELSPTAQVQGAAVAAVVPGSGAAKAGLTGGDVITSVDGHTVTSASTLSTVMKQYSPGGKVKLGYTDGNGQSHTVTVTLGEGPAD